MLLLSEVLIDWEFSLRLSKLKEGTFPNRWRCPLLLRSWLGPLERFPLVALCFRKFQESLPL